jgi:hypothetical protein
MLERAGVERVSLPGYRTAISAPDRRTVERLGTILAVADYVGHRISGTAGALTVKRHTATWALGRSDLGVDADLGERFERTFGIGLRLDGG